MIEQGLVLLVQSNAVVLAMCPVGGYLGSLPKDQPRPSWSFNIISHVPDYAMKGRSQFTMRRIQIDSFGNTPDQAVLLSNAIAAVLDGFNGTLADVDSTVVQGTFLSDMIDYFDDVARSYRRMLEVEIYYNQGLFSADGTGTAGTTGSGGEMTFALTAAVNISQYMVVAAAGGIAYIADQSIDSQISEVAGLATAAALATAQVTVQNTGVVTNVGWNWTAGQAIFLGTNGGLTQTAPASGFLQVIGTPLSATSLLLDIQDPIQL